jgi:iron complex outermembrane recepter protein
VASAFRRKGTSGGTGRSADEPVPSYVHCIMIRMLSNRSVLSSFAAVLGLVVTPSLGMAQPAPIPRFIPPPVTVTAQKEPADPQRLPVSLTLVTLETLWNGGINTIGDASIYAPNTYFSDFTARKLSNPRFRGIGSSPANPAITTNIDGVPQLNTNSSSIELLDVAQLEFVRGPQSALFGRNTLGGLVNISSTRPSSTEWNGAAVVPFGNFGAVDVRAKASGPLGTKAAVGFAIGHSRRDGFTTNDITGRDVDSRDATFGKAQLLLTPTPAWEARVIYTGERARDGDYALNDLAELRARPWHTQRDVEGHTDRDVTALTIIARHTGKKAAFTTTTGIVRWKTDDLTDLDYSELPLLTRTNAEKDLQFTQELRFASTPDGAVSLGGKASLKWQGGVFLFTQNYDQAAVNNFAPFVLSPFLPFAVAQHSPDAALDDTGVGIYGNGTIAFGDKANLTVGARFDRENRKADLSTFFVAPVIISVPVNVKTEKSFSNVSPQAAFAYRVLPDGMAYVSVTGGFKAGGFNPASPAGQEAYDEEHTWNVEGGLKSMWASRRVKANLAVFSIDWQDLQLNLPNQQVPGQFFISNVGKARSTGVELELTGRPRAGIDLFAHAGYTRARFGTGTTSSGLDVSGKDVPNTPDYTGTLGFQLSRGIKATLIYGRTEAVFYGAFKYDDANLAGQEAYSLVNLRAGARNTRLFAEGWIRNAFDTKYVPVAFAYSPQLAQSGFIGESGRPRTFGISAGVTF